MDTSPPDSGRLVLRRISRDTGNGWPISKLLTLTSSTPQIQPNQASLECCYRLTNRVVVLLSRRAPGLMLLASTAWHPSISFAKDMIHSEKQVLFSLLFVRLMSNFVKYWSDICLNMSLFLQLCCVMIDICAIHNRCNNMIDVAA